MTTWQEDLKEDKKLVRELHQLHLDRVEKAIRTELIEDRIKSLINKFDNAVGDKTKLEIAGRLISLIQKVML